MRINMPNRFVPNWSAMLLAALVLNNTFSLVTSADYIFEQLGDDIDGEAAYDSSGRSVALSTSGKIVAIGSRFNDGVNGTDSGHARVYEFTDGSWVQMGQDLDGEAPDDWAGWQLDLSASGKIVAVGAVFNDDGGDDAGQLRVFEYDGNLWEQLGTDLDGDVSPLFLGASLELSADGSVLASAGSQYARVLRYDGVSSWNIVGHDIPRSESNRAWVHMLSVSSDGSILAFGEVTLNFVRVLRYDVGLDSWIPMGQNITGVLGNFGQAVSLSSDGTIVAIGAPLYNSSTGRVSVFKYDVMTMEWKPLGSSLEGSQFNEGFGNDLELSSDGQRMAVGAYLHDNFTDVDTGKAELYEFDGVEWVQVGPSLVGEAEGDTAGFAVAISGNGKTIAYGARLNDGINGTDSGHARVYKSKRLTPGASGDPHFKTWSGESFDFHGLCDLVLLKNQAFETGLGMDINIRTKQMKQWSYISNVVLRIGEDILEIMGEANGEPVTYWINGVAGNEDELTNNALLPNSISGYPIFYRKISSKQHEFSVDLGEDEKIVMKTWKDLVRVDLHGATETNFGDSLGLMGTYSKGLHMGRDGMTVFADFDAFGQEWQVLPSEPTLFHSREGPQAPEKCAVPSSTKLRRRLSENVISQEEAVIACARVDEEDRDMCIFDIMATNDLEISGAY